MFGADLVAETIAVVEAIKRWTKAKGGSAVAITVVVSGVVVLIDQAREGDMNVVKFVGTWVSTFLGASGGYMLAEDIARKIKVNG